MDQVTQSNAGNAEETAAAAEELNSQAAMLNDAVGRLQALTGLNTTSAAHVAPAAKTAVAKPAPRSAPASAASAATRKSDRNGQAAPVAAGDNLDRFFSAAPSR